MKARSFQLRPRHDVKPPSLILVTWEVIYSVADPDPFDTDPDPAFHFDTDLDPAFHFDTDPDPAV